jgi:hypothetical protein
MNDEKYLTFGWDNESIKLDRNLSNHIAHHVNNPLTVLTLVLSKKGITDEDKEVMLKSVQRIKDYVAWLSIHSQKE